MLKLSLDKNYLTRKSTKLVVGFILTLLSFSLHRPDESGWTGLVCLQVSVLWQKWAEVACGPAYCFLCPEHAGSTGSLAKHRCTPKTSAAHRL